MTLLADPRTEPPHAGVIADARRRRVRRRLAVAALSILALGAFILAGGSRSPATRSIASASSPRPLSGTPLGNRTRLRLLVGGAGPATGPVRLVDVDSRSVRTVTLPGGGRLVARLEPFGSAALAAVECSACAVPGALYVVGYDGSTRAVAGAGANAQVLTVAGSGASWTLTGAGSRPCMLRHGSAPGVEAPCGEMLAASTTSVVIGQTDAELLLNAHGAILASAAQLAPLAGGRVVEATPPDPVSGRSQLVLVNLATGARRTITWPAAPAGYELGLLIPAPGGARVAVELFDAVTHPAFAADLWVLDAQNGALTHVPGFPALEGIKQSSVAFTTDGRLLIPSHYQGRNVLGVWRPGAATLAIRALPRLSTYYDAVALTPR